MDVWSLIAQSIISTAVAAALVTVLLGFYFNSRLETHKSQLALENQRRIQDFNLYTTKRHEVYPELYKLILIADGNIRGLVGLRSVLTFEEFNREDLENYLKEKNVVQGKKNELLSLWDADKDRGIKKMKKYLRLLEIHQAKLTFHEAKNYFLMSELYLSERVSNQFTILLGFVGQYLTTVEYPYGVNVADRSSLEHAIIENSNILKQLMYDELTVSYYK